MENYEKKYKSLVKAVKTLKEANPSDEGIQNWVKDNVPELQDSEDERIRNEIISFLKEGTPYYCPNSVRRQEWITWFEKQGETFTQKDVDDAYLKGVVDTKNEIEKQYDTSYQIRKDIATFIFNYRGDIKDRAKWMNYLGIKVSFVEKQGEQKPITIDIDKMVSKYSHTKDRDFGLPVNCQIRAYRQGINDALNLSLGIKKQGEQKPTWSEEDGCYMVQIPQR